MDEERLLREEVDRWEYEANMYCRLYGEARKHIDHLRKQQGLPPLDPAVSLPSDWKTDL